MSVTVRFHPAAEEELVAAAAWYESQQPNLGARFLLEVEDAVSRVQVQPLLYQALDGDVRRAPIRVFPYALIFRVQRAQCVVLAVMHLHREPGYWRER